MNRVFLIISCFLILLIPFSTPDLAAQASGSDQRPSWEQDLYQKRSKRYDRSVWFLRRYVKRVKKVDGEWVSRDAGKKKRKSKMPAKAKQTKQTKPQKEQKERNNFRPSGKKFKGFLVNELELNGVPCIHLKPTKSDPNCTLLYFHGGAYLEGPWKQQYNMVVEMAKRTNAEVYIAYYRLGPKDRFPAAQEDGLSVYEALIEDHDPKKIIPFGDSAGGGLTLSLFKMVRDKGLPLPGGQILIAPWLHIWSDNPEIYEIGKVDPLLTPSLNHHSSMKLTDPEESENPLYSPFFAKLDQLPPTLIMIGTWDILWPDTRDFYQRAIDEGHEVDMVVGKEMFHVWPAGMGFFPEAETAIMQMSDWVKDKVGD